MTKRIKQKWIKALRSGEYKQGEGNLLYIDNAGNETYCCLGVLELVCGTSKEDLKGKSYPHNLKHSNSPKEFLLRGADSISIILGEMNDGTCRTKKSFKSIATYIEKNL